MNIYFYILMFVILFAFALLIIFWNKKTLDNKSKIYFKKILLEISNKNSYKEQIIEYDKLYHKILIELWYNWDFWKILKQNPKEILDINKIWSLHKLRNNLVHEFSKHEDNFLEKSALDYKKELLKLLV